jgi:hypothetical protein
MVNQGATPGPTESAGRLACFFPFVPNRRERARMQPCARAGIGTTSFFISPKIVRGWLRLRDFVWYE